MLRCLVIIALLLGFATPVNAATRNCDSNAMIYCGAYSKDELIRKMTQGDSQNSSKDIRALFDKYDIKPSDVRSTNTVNGEVRKDGTVWVKDKKVASNAYSYGRENMSGSTKQGSLYKRPTTTSFNSPSLDAYVHIQDGKFKWAIIKSCGNLVTATPVSPPKKPAVEQKTIIKQTVVEKPVIHKVVEQKVVEKVVEKPAPAPLPKTGNHTNTIASLVGLFSISIAFGLYVRSRQNLNRTISGV